MLDAEKYADILKDALQKNKEQGIIFLCELNKAGAYTCDVARILASKHIHVWIWVLAEPEDIKEEAFDTLCDCAAMNIPIYYVTDKRFPVPFGCSMYFDAIHWRHHRLSVSLIPRYRRVSKWLTENMLHFTLIRAMDLPDVCTDSHQVAEQVGSTFKTELLYTLLRGNCEDVQILDEKDMRVYLPSRPFDAYKGSCGHALIVAGSLGMAGAAALCAQAALRTGAGLVTSVCSADILPILQTLVPCAMCVPADKFSQAIAYKSALAVGPGLGLSKQKQEWLEMLCTQNIKQVWDADALTWLAQNPRKLSEEFVLTPHYGEASRLLGWKLEQVIKDPLSAAHALYRLYEAVIVLKGPITVIKFGAALTCNLTGSPGMATGGSGDVLTGMIAGLLAQGIPPYDAACVGVYLHGKAGEEAANRRGIRSMLAADILEALCID